MTGDHVVADVYEQISAQSAAVVLHPHWHELPWKVMGSKRHSVVQRLTGNVRLGIMSVYIAST